MVIIWKSSPFSFLFRYICRSERETQSLSKYLLICAQARSNPALVQCVLDCCTRKLAWVCCSALTHCLSLSFFFLGSVLFRPYYFFQMCFESAFYTSIRCRILTWSASATIYSRMCIVKYHTNALISTCTCTYVVCIAKNKSVSTICAADCMDIICSQWLQRCRIYLFVCCSRRRRCCDITTLIKKAPKKFRACEYAFKMAAATTTTYRDIIDKQK